jgi:small conductance mechanosensitive channel
MTIDLPNQDLIRWGLAIVLIVLAWPVSSRLTRVLQLAAMRRAGGKGDGVTTFKFLTEGLRFAVLIGAALVGLSLIGVNTASIAAILAAATLAVGLALQGTLANVAAGVLIILLRLYRVGDVIETLGQVGTVRLVSLFTTEIETFTGRQVLLPNGEVLKQPIVNVNRYPRRRIDVNLVLAWSTEGGKAGDAALAALARMPGILSDPAPAVVVTAMDPRGPTLSLRAWAGRDDAGRLALEAPFKVYEVLRQGGFAMAQDAILPTPQIGGQ